MPDPNLPNRWKAMAAVWISVGLAVVTLLTYGRVARHEFINLDDQLYVTENLRVQNGLTGENFGWALGGVCAGNWHPVTMLSHMMDCQLFGLKAGAHHLVNLALHMANMVLLFLVLRLMTGALGRSAVVAGLFALHPLHVESVAWVSERKDVLSTLFFLLTVWAYAQYARAEAAKVKKINYLLALGCFALGLMSKPMLVTLPFVLLLLDFWPLGRITQGAVAERSVSPLAGGRPLTPALSPDGGEGGESVGTRRIEEGIGSGRLNALGSLLLEKVPFFLLAAISSVVTYLVQQQSGAMTLLAHLPMGERVINALMAYATYLGKTFWPVSLAVYYPYAVTSGWGWIAGAGALVGVITFGAGRWLKAAPWLAVGWFWFLGTLVPVIGLVQVGGQALADRYTYIPLIGVFIVVVWAGWELLGRWRTGRLVAGVVVVIGLAACGVMTRQQLGYWSNSETLFRHTLAVTRDNSFAHFSLGSALEKKDKLDEAIAQAEEALRLQPDYPEARLNLGIVLAKRGDYPAAITNLLLAIRSQPSAEPHFNLGKTLSECGDVAGAMTNYLAALKLQPDHAEAHNNLGNLQLRESRVAEAAEHYRAAIAAKPKFAEAYYNLGNAFAREGKLAEAAAHYAAAIQVRPNYTNAHFSLGRAMLEMARPVEAVREFEWLVQANPQNAEAHFFLANVLVRLQNTAEAIGHLKEVVRLRPDSVEAHNNLAWILATHPEARLRDSAQAMVLAGRALEMTHGTNAGVLDTLAAAQAAAGKFAEAVPTANRALELARAAGDSNFAAQVQAHIDLYRAGQPFFQKH